MDGQFGWGTPDDIDGCWRKGPWTAQEDKLLIEHVTLHGEGKWNSVSKLTGLRRSGKSCRLRWVNYLRPDLKKGNITPQEELIIQELQALWGNRWSAIARSLPGRTDNEIKNYWRTHFKIKSKPSKRVERARARFHLVRQQQQARVQKQQEEQLQQQQQGAMREITKQLEEATLVEYMPAPPEMAAAYNMDYMPYYVLQEGGGGGGGGGDGDVDDEETSWGCLWNLGDVPA